MTRRNSRNARHLALAALVAVPTVAWGVLHQPSLELPAPRAERGAVRFAPLDVYIDAGSDRLGAWQVELAPRPEFAGRVTIVGIAGGDVPFAEPPYFDERAIQNERVIIADFETDADVQRTGRSRVAQVQLRIESDEDPAFDVRLHTAARHDGAAIDAAVEAVLRRPRQSGDGQQHDDQNESDQTNDTDTTQNTEREQGG